MQINKVKSYQFSYHFLMSLHVPKSINPARMRYPVGKSAQGSNQKVTVEYSIMLLFELSKSKSRKKAGGYVNVSSSPFTHSTPIWSVANQSLRRTFVCFFLGIQNQTFADVIPKLIAQFKIERLQIERTSQSAAFEIMRFCAFAMQIGNYRASACPTILRNGLAKMTSTCGKIPQKRQLIYGFMAS